MISCVIDCKLPIFLPICGWNIFILPTHCNIIIFMLSAKFFAQNKKTSFTSPYAVCIMKDSDNGLAKYDY